MPKNTSYSLPKDSKAWQQALDSVASSLPDQSGYKERLSTLPIFALIVVAPMSDRPRGVDISDKIQSWGADQNNWQLVTVANDDDAKRITFSVPSNENNNTITNAAIYRYLIVPDTYTLMAAAKKNAAAHILDEQLSSRLRQELKDHLTPSLASPATDDAPSLTDPIDPVDCHILPIDHILRPHKLACFDMDSTLIEQEVIDELAKAAGVGDQVAKITESAMRGEIDFDESFARRVALLEGLSTEVLDDICDQLTLSPGARVTLSALKALGYHTVLVSGGFTYFAKRIANLLNIDEVHANELDIESAQMTGQIQLPIVNGEQKALLTSKIAKDLNLTMTQVICVGDGANDLTMMAHADLGIAYHAKPIVQSRADAAINVTGLEGVLYALGYLPPQLES